jgi:Na+/phosphate symporter
MTPQDAQVVGRGDPVGGRGGPLARQSARVVPVEALECKELRARVLFFRAKRCLSRQLVRRGFGKGLLLTALGLFGWLTSPGDSASAGAVTASSLSVGAVAKFVGLAGTSSGMAVVVTIAGVSLTLTLEHFVYVAFFLGLGLVSVTIALLWDA